MGTQALAFEQLHEQATAIPQGLIEAMNDRDGQGGGLVLTQDYIKVLDRYVAYVRSLPEDLEQVCLWLGYAFISEPELRPRSMRRLFLDLKQHAARWPLLHERCQSLTFTLGAAAADIENVGSKILEECAQMRASLRNADDLDNTGMEEPIVLAKEEIRLVRKMAAGLLKLREDLDHFDREVEAVRGDAEAFRDRARFTLVPAVHEKNRAADRYDNSSQCEDIKWELGWLDTERVGVRRQYEAFSAASAAGWNGSGPASALSHSIYDSKAQDLRTELHGLEYRRIGLAWLLESFFRVGGRVQRLKGELGQLELELLDVVTACAHLQSAWQTVETYIDTSRDRLLKITTLQQLVIFEIRFKQFLGQWATIGKIVHDMCCRFGSTRSTRALKPAICIS